MSKIEDEVCADIQARAALGLTKYGVSLERTDLSTSELVQHAYEEALDLSNYLKRVQKESSLLSKDDLKIILKAIDFLFLEGRQHDESLDIDTEVFLALTAKLKTMIAM